MTEEREVKVPIYDEGKGGSHYHRGKGGAYGLFKRRLNSTVFLIFSCFNKKVSCLLQENIFIIASLHNAVTGEPGKKFNLEGDGEL